MMIDMEREIQNALDCLDLPTLVSKADIKKRYRQLARAHHPDVTREEQGRMEKINEAYALLMAYIDDFRYTFDTDEIAKQYPGAEHAKKFKP